MFNYKKYLTNYILFISVMFGALTGTLFIKQLPTNAASHQSQNGLTCPLANCSKKLNFSEPTPLNIDVKHLPEGLD
jgi:hypothetical protein